MRIAKHLNVIRAHTENAYIYNILYSFYAGGRGERKTSKSYIFSTLEMNKIFLLNKIRCAASIIYDHIIF